MCAWMLVCDHEIRIMCARKYPETAVPNGKSWRHVSPPMMFCSISCPCVPRLDSYLMRLVFNTFADIKSQFALRTLAAVGCLRPNDVRLPTSPPAGHEHRNCWIETTPRLLGQKWAPPHCDRIRSVRNSVESNGDVECITLGYINLFLHHLFHLQPKVLGGSSVPSLQSKSISSWE